LIKIDDIVEEDELLDEDLDFAYGSKKKLNKAVDDGDMEAEDALFMEGYLDDDEE
tara:strand:- start:517 stop:681 length:165 start_codon:yes stop_codon:yes gene_type:complete